MFCFPTLYKNYTIPRKIRELQLVGWLIDGDGDYTIPRKIRELQPLNQSAIAEAYYTIPRKIRELQPDTASCRGGSIIPYQEKLGNYNR